jgi:outer membrane assembly lipoprotein YfiO
MKMRNTLLFGLVMILMASGIASCAGGKKVKKRKYECSPRVAEAVKKYEKKKYSSVKTILDDVLVQCAGSSVTDTAHYYLGMALLKMKLYLEAKLEFSRLMQEHPNSFYYEEALFRSAYSVFKISRHMERDQTETREAYRLFRDFLENYPSSAFADSSRKYMKRAVNKLAKKEYLSAEFYRKIGEKEAAIVCYRTFIKDYPGSDYTALARLNMGRLLLEIKRTQEAKEVLDELISQEKKGDLAKKARELRVQIRE